MVRRRRGAAPVAIRLRDIADKAGVSINTASRALTGKSDVSAETKARVMALAQRLGYAPNQLARSLLHGRSRTIGLVVTDCTNPFYASLIRAVEGVLSRHSYGLLLATSNEDPDKENKALALLRERRVDGLLLTPVDVDAPHVRQLLRSQVPMVLLGRKPSGYRGPFVGTDNVSGGALITRHLLDQGHRRIAHFTRSDRASSARERLSGYREALAKAKVVYRSDLVHAFDPSTDGGRSGAAAILSMSPRPTAVFTYNDAQAAGLMLQLQEAGVDVPGDISIAGFDNIELSSLVRPMLTTVAQPILEIGERGAQMLIDVLEKRSKGESILLAPSLVLRQSTSALRTMQQGRTWAA